MLFGIDWGGTKMEIVALDEGGVVRGRHRCATPSSSYADCLDAAAALVREAERQAGASGPLGIGIPGSPAPRTGLVRNSNAVLLNGKPLGRDLEQRLQRGVCIANDANCLAVSEAVDGAGAGAHVVFGIIIGTGHGGGIAIDGRVHTGFQGFAAEIGHYSLPWMTAEEYPGPQCWCGKRGCLEMYTCGSGFERDYAQAAGAPEKAGAIIAAMRAGDAVSRAAYERFADRLARSLALLVNIVDPDVFVLGGGMSNVDELYDDLPRLIARHVFGDGFETPVRKAAHGDSSGVRGAAWLWKDQTSER